MLTSVKRAWRKRKAFKLKSKSFLIHPKSEMTEMLSDGAVTNQSHWESWMTVKDISGPSSFALARRCRAVTTNSHAAPIAQWKLFAQIVFHPITNCATLTRSLLSSSHLALSCCGGQTEGHRRCWWGWTGGCVLQKSLKWQLSFPGLYLFQKLQNGYMCIHSKLLLAHMHCSNWIVHSFLVCICSMLHFDRVLELLSESLFCPHCSWRLTPVDPPADLSRVTN